VPLVPSGEPVSSGKLFPVELEGLVGLVLLCSTRGRVEFRVGFGINIVERGETGYSEECCALDPLVFSFQVRPETGPPVSGIRFPLGAWGSGFQISGKVVPCPAGLRAFLGMFPLQRHSQLGQQSSCPRSGPPASVGRYNPRRSWRCS